LRTPDELRAAAPALGISATSLRRVLSGQRLPGAVVVANTAAWLKRNPESDSARLTLEQRDLLTITRQHDLPRLRRAARVTEEQLDQAIAGEALDPAVIARLAGFLTA